MEPLPICPSNNCTLMPLPPTKRLTLTGLERWCGNTNLSDVTLAVGDRLIRAHRLVLANASPVFARMFETDMRESVTSMVRRNVV